MRFCRYLQNYHTAEHVCKCVSAGTYRIITLQGTVCKCISAGTYRIITLQGMVCKCVSAGTYRIITLQGTVCKRVSAGTYRMITLQRTACKFVSAGTYRMIALQGTTSSCSIISCHMNSAVNAYSPVHFFLLTIQCTVVTIFTTCHNINKQCMCPRKIYGNSVRAL